MPSFGSGGGFSADNDSATYTVVSGSSGLEIAGPVHFSDTLGISGSITSKGEAPTFESATASKPNVTITNTTNDVNGAFLTLKKDRSAGTAAADDNIGTLTWYGDNDAQEQTQFANMTCYIGAATDGTERGKLRMSVAEYDGTVTAGFEIRGDSDDGVIDWSLGAGANSFGSISGDVGLGHDAAALYFGTDSEIMLIHDHNVGLELKGDGANTALRINNTAADGDPRVEFQLGGTTKWSVGCEDGDSDKFVIENGNGALGAAPALEITSGGEVSIDSPGVKLAKSTANNTLNFGLNNCNDDGGGCQYDSTTGDMAARSGTVIGQINTTNLAPGAAAYGNVYSTGILATDAIVATPIDGYIIRISYVRTDGFSFTALRDGGEVTAHASATSAQITFNWVAL